MSRRSSKSVPFQSTKVIPTVSAIVIGEDDILDEYGGHSMNSPMENGRKERKHHKQQQRGSSLGDDDEGAGSGSHPLDFPVAKKNSFSNPRNRNGSIMRDMAAAAASSGKEGEIKAWPPALRADVVKSFSRGINETAGGKFLDQYEWPEGLKQTIYKSCKKVALRFFVVDDSGSMITNDGKRVVAQGSMRKLVQCTRWAELVGSLNFMADLSEAMQVPSEFRLLNGSDPILVGLGDDGGEGLSLLKEVFEESPAGQTPLCMHIDAIVEEIRQLEPYLKATNQKVSVIIASDGESSDGSVAESLRPLTTMPVLVTVRLCTSEESVLKYWDSIDNQLEIDIDVLDDQQGDARQVKRHNGWLTYGAPIHRMREFGASMKELDIIDESTLSSEQMRIMCGFLFMGGNAKDLPHPGVDWKTFVNKIKTLNLDQPKVFCTLAGAMRPWVDIKELNRIYGSANGAGGGGGCAIS